MLEYVSDSHPIQSGAAAAAVAVITIVLAFAMLRWSRRRNCLYHNKELGEVVPSLSYRDWSANVETASVNSSEVDVSARVLEYSKHVVSNRLDDRVAHLSCSSPPPPCCPLLPIKPIR